MQLFMRNIAFSASDTDIRLALALKLHSPPFPLDPPTNFDIDLFKSKQGKPIGLLTLPTNELGNIFLRTYGQTGISVQYRTIYFSLSNKQRDGHIEKVRASAWEDPRILQEQKKRMAEISEPISLLRFSFGCFCRDGSFSAEINTSGTSTVVCNTEPRQVRLEVTPNKSSRVIFGIDVSEFSSPTVVFATYTPSQITATAFSAPLNGSFHFFLESDSPPVFGSYCKQDSFLGLSVKEVSERRPSLIEGREMPPACQHLCLTFASRSDLDTFAERCKTIHLPGARESDIRLVARRIHTEGKLARLDKFIEKLEFGLAFEAEKAVITGVLEPNDVRKLLKEDVLKLQHDYELSAAHIFRYFAGALRVPGLSPNKDRRRNRPRRRRGDAPAPTSTSPHTSSLVQQLREAISRYTEELRQPLRRYSLSPALFQSYHLILTPTKRVLEGPLPDQSNSVLRRFGHHESFLRVSFQDENGSKLRRDPNISITGLLKSRFRPLLIDGFRLAGRKFDFLGYSMSGLKEYSLWFVNPFQGDDNLTMDATRIRDQLGDFTKLIHRPALLGARWAQAFSASDPSDTLASEEIFPLDDRRSASGSVFTDGCGTISPELSRAVWSKLHRVKSKAPRKRVPSCFQIRMGGAKGVVVQDPRLSGRAICLRPSQTKFEALPARVRTLDITATSSRPIPMFLNRPLIVLLEYLGVAEKSLIDLQDAAIQDVLAIHDSLSEAARVFTQHGLGASFRLPSLFNNILSQLELDIQNPAYGEAEGFHHQLVETCLIYASTHVLHEIKYRAHIPVPGSVTLLGVSDEWDCLEEGEIYATVHDERSARYEAIKGKVLITRSPQIHVGDVQFATAVRRPELEHLTNVVVFSCKGERSLPSMLGGGDLDGDIYNLILDPDLFPATTAAPGSYEGLGYTTTKAPCTVTDVADFVINYIQSDLVGYISILHLRISDLKDPACDECIKLAEKASHAVDFPKTGTPVTFSDLPKPDRLKPDFLSWEGTNLGRSSAYYPSKKVLGVLFRRVPMPAEHSQRRYNLFEEHSKILDALRLVPYHTLGLEFQFPSEELLDEMEDKLWAYSEQLMVIAQAHTDSKSPNAHLTEAELVSGTIQAKWADHHKRREAVIAMNLQTRELTKLVRHELREADVQSTQDEDEYYEEDDDYWIEDGYWTADARENEVFHRAWAAWNAAEHALLQDSEIFGARSFSLIALGAMLEVVKGCRRRLQGL